jgi:hypothetical protein
LNAGHDHALVRVAAVESGRINADRELGQKAIAWWKQRSPDPVPESAERAVELASAGALATTHRIKVRAVAGEPYERIIDYELGPKPDPIQPEVYEFYEEEIPF